MTRRYLTTLVFFRIHRCCNALLGHNLVSLKKGGCDPFVQRRCKVQILPHLIGQKGRTKLKVEQDTGATITIPKKNSTALPGSRDADVVVRGPTTSAAVSAATRLELLVENVLNSNKYALCCGLHCLHMRFLQYYLISVGHLCADWSILISSPSRSTAVQRKLPLSNSSRVSQETPKQPRQTLRSLSLYQQSRSI